MQENDRPYRYGDNDSEELKERGEIPDFGQEMVFPESEQRAEGFAEKRGDN